MEKPEETIQELIEKMDPSSYDFKLLSTIDNLLVLLEKKYSVSKTVTDIIDGELTLFLIKKNNKEVFWDNLKQNLLLETDEILVEKIIKDISFYIEEKEERPIPNIVSPSQAISSIQERLSNTTIIAPIKRDYSIEKIPETVPTTTPNLKSDPYREMPQE